MHSPRALHPIRHRFLTALFVAAAAWPAAAGTLRVDAALASGANDGSSWADAFQGSAGLQAALAVAQPGDQVWVAAGTYLPTATGQRNVYFRLLSGVEIYGGFAGGENVLSQRDLVSNVAILSADLAGDDGSGALGDNSFHVVHANGADATAVLDGFLVTGGNANTSGNNQDRGGGILGVGAIAPQVRNCRFVSNRCTFGGGAGYLSGGAQPTFTDCVFENNSGGSFGGAFDMATSVAATFRRCTFRANTAARAGGIEIFGASPVKVFDCLFTGNTSTGGGGGGALFVSTSPAQVRNCTVVANTATAHGTGGILVSGGAPLFVNCVVAGNVGQGGATGIAAQISPSTLNVTYTLTDAAYAGTGNVTGAPLFDACGPHPFALALGSAGVDAGDNASVDPASDVDLAHLPRFTDVPSVADSGSGSAPIVDMGAYESAPDCNANGVPDTCDIAAGTSLDANHNGLPDECDCVAGSLPTVFCTAKTNSLGCLPQIDYLGTPSAGASTSFTIRAANLLNHAPGVLLYGYAPAAVPFQGGFRCVAAPFKRVGAGQSGGSSAGADCTGVLAFDFNAYIAAGIDPLLAVPGQLVAAQFWGRDPAASFGTSLTDALSFSICQ